MKSSVLMVGLTILIHCPRVLAAGPATIEQAAAKLDLETFPLPDGAEVAGHRRLAELDYTVQGSSQEAFTFVVKQLRTLGWKSLNSMHDQGEYFGDDYERDGFQVYISAFPQQPGVAHVTVTQRGNVPLEEVPMPAGVEKQYSFPSTVMYKTSASVEQTAQACRDLMLGAGWEPYGSAGDTAYYRQNAVQVDVNVMSAPGLGGATAISISSKLLSLELPAPPFADDFSYTDDTSAIIFDTQKTPEEAFAYYREELTKSGWQVTTDEPFKLDWKLAMIFRNAGQEMITVTTHNFEGKTRVQLDHQNASEVAEEEFLGLESVGEKAKYRDVTWITVELATPAGSQLERVEDWAVKFNLNNADSFAIAEKLIGELSTTGWQPSDEKKAVQPVIRSYQLTKGEHTLQLVSVQPPKLPAWVGVVGIGGVKLDVQ